MPIEERRCRIASDDNEMPPRVRFSVTHTLKMFQVITRWTEYDPDWYLSRKDTHERGGLEGNEWSKLEPPSGQHPTSPFDPKKRETSFGNQKRVRIRNECEPPRSESESETSVQARAARGRCILHP